MPTELQPARGTHDLIGEDERRHQFVIDTARRIAGIYGFDEWSTPIFEDTRVFALDARRDVRCGDERNVHVSGPRRGYHYAAAGIHRWSVSRAGQ